MTAEIIPFPVAGVELPAKLRRNPFALYLAGLSTHKGRVGQFTSVAAFLRAINQPNPFELRWELVTPEVTTAMRAWLVAHRAPATARKVLGAVKGTLRQCYRLGRMPEDAYRRAVELDPVRGKGSKRGRMVPVGELRAMFQACAREVRPETRARNAAILALMCGAGLRLAELVGLDEADVINAIDITTRTPAVLILRVLGKGAKVRDVPLPSGARAALVAWLSVREDLAAGDAPGPLFYAADRRGALVVGRRPSESSISKWLRALARASGVGHVAPHDLRRTYVSTLLDGTDIRTAAQLAGHASVTSTEIYDRRDEAAARKAVELVCVPFE